MLPVRDAQVLMVQIGMQEAADAKFRETLRLYARLPSCKLILAGCTHDAGASPSFFVFLLDRRLRLPGQATRPLCSRWKRKG